MQTKLPFEVVKQSDLFADANVYYSGAIRGELPNPLIGYELVKFMLTHGAKVPSAHVAARTVEERQQIFYQMSGEGFDSDGNDVRTPEMAYRVDMKWVDEATHIVAVVDGASHGVGMEIMRGLLKPRMGLNPTPILCLVSEQNFSKVSWMLTGAWIEFSYWIRVATYSDVEAAKNSVHSFLTIKY